MFATESQAERTTEPMGAQPRTYARRIDCGGSRPAAAPPSRGGAPRPVEAWEHTRRSRT